MTNLTEFRNMAHELTTIKNFEGSDLSAEEYINSIKVKFGKDLSEKATEIPIIEKQDSYEIKNSLYLTNLFSVFRLFQTERY